MVSPFKPSYGMKHIKLKLYLPLMGVTLSKSQINIKMEIGMSSLTAVHTFLKMSLKKSKNLKKMLRKSPTSNV